MNVSMEERGRIALELQSANRHTDLPTVRFWVDAVCDKLDTPKAAPVRAKWIRVKLPPVRSEDNLSRHNTKADKAYDDGHTDRDDLLQERFDSLAIVLGDVETPRNGETIEQWLLREAIARIVKLKSMPNGFKSELTAGDLRSM